MLHMVKVDARFVAPDGLPLDGNRFRVALYDKDILFDDKLGQTRPDADGRVQFFFDISEAWSFDSLHELKPDLYVVVFEGDREVFRSQVFHNVGLLRRDLGPEENSRTKDLGTFVVQKECPV